MFFDVKQYEVHTTNSEIFFPRIINLNPVKPNRLQEIEGLAEDVKRQYKQTTKSRMWPFYKTTAMML